MRVLLRSRKATSIERHLLMARANGAHR